MDITDTMDIMEVTMDITGGTTGAIIDSCWQLFLKLFTYYGRQTIEGLKVRMGGGVRERVRLG